MISASAAPIRAKYGRRYGSSVATTAKSPFGSRARASARAESVAGAASVMRSSAHFDVFPEAKAIGHAGHRGSRCLVAPRGALVAGTGDHHVIELHAVRTRAVPFRL